MTAAAMPLNSGLISPGFPKLADTKTSEQKANEPSMEEILASIRRIIADDAGQPKAPRKSPAAELAHPAGAEAAPEAHCDRAG